MICEKMSFFPQVVQPWFELFVDFWKFTKIWKDLQHRNTELFLFWFLDVQNNFMFPTCKNSQKWVKNQKSTDKHSSFDSRRYRSVWYLFSCTYCDILWERIDLCNSSQVYCSPLYGSSKYFWSKIDRTGYSVSRGQHRGHAMKKNGRRPRQDQQQSKRVMTTRQKTCIEV